GECHYQLADAASARDLTLRALALCEQRRDSEGVITQLGNLFQIFRYGGEPAAAATVGTRLVGLLEAAGRHTESTSLQDRVRRVSAGEPPCRVVVRVYGLTYELDNLPGPAVDGYPTYEFVRNRPTLART